MTGTESKLDVKGEIEALTNALLTLTPSRNYLIQMFRLLPADFDSISTTYPELFDDPVARDALVRVFGLQIGDRVDLGVGLAQSLAQWSAYLTDTFGQDDSEKRWRGLSSSYGVEVPNSLVEWIETKVRMVESEPRLGGSTGKILDLLLGREQVTLSD